MRYLLLPVNCSNLIQGIDRWRQASMNAEYFIIDDSCESKVVEDFSAVSPHIHRAILPQAFIIEPINLRDLSAFMITSDQ